MCPSCCLKYNYVAYSRLFQFFDSEGHAKIIGEVSKIVFMLMPFTHNDSNSVHKYDQLI